MSETYQVREYPLEVEGTADGVYFSKGWHEQESFVSDANYEAFLEDESGWDEGEMSDMTTKDRIRELHREIESKAPESAAILAIEYAPVFATLYTDEPIPQHLEDVARDLIADMEDILEDLGA